MPVNQVQRSPRLTIITKSRESNARVVIASRFHRRPTLDRRAPRIHTKTTEKIECEHFSYSLSTTISLPIICLMASYIFLWMGSSFAVTTNLTFIAAGFQITAMHLQKHVIERTITIVVASPLIYTLLGASSLSYHLEESIPSTAHDFDILFGLLLPCVLHHFCHQHNLVRDTLLHLRQRKHRFRVIPAVSGQSDSVGRLFRRRLRTPVRPVRDARSAHRCTVLSYNAKNCSRHSFQLRARAVRNPRRYAAHHRGCGIAVRANRGPARQRLSSVRLLSRKLALSPGGQHEHRIHAMHKRHVHHIDGEETGPHTAAVPNARSGRSVPRRARYVQRARHRAQGVACPIDNIQGDALCDRTRAWRDHRFNPERPSASCCPTNDNLASLHRGLRKSSCRPNPPLSQDELVIIGLHASYSDRTVQILSRCSAIASIKCRNISSRTSYPGVAGIPKATTFFHTRNSLVPRIS